MTVNNMLLFQCLCHVGAEHHAETGLKGAGIFCASFFCILEGSGIGACLWLSQWLRHPYFHLYFFPAPLKYVLLVLLAPF